MPLCISSIADDIADETVPMPPGKLSGIVPNSIAAAATADVSHINTAAINFTTVEVKPKHSMHILMFEYFGRN
jgi:hypothetical protein